MIEQVWGGSAPALPADDGLNFLDAQRAVAAFGGGAPLPFLLALAGTADPLRVYLEAACAQRGRAAETSFLPYGTLGQFLVGSAAPVEPEVFLLFPWDLAPELDWRSGVPLGRVSPADVLLRAEQAAATLTRRGAQILYVPAPTPPVTGHPVDDAALHHGLSAIAASCGAKFLPSAAFSLSGYFASGCPVGGAWLGRVALRVVDMLLAPPVSPAKLLVTDLDNTLWGGVIAEVGSEGIAYEQAGAGFRHHVYQSLLMRLRREGALLAAVTRNDRDVVYPALSSDAMILGTEDFVAVCASYEAKSSQIRDLAGRLNIGLDAVVFVDDNPVELAEVRLAIPEARVYPFPGRDEGLPAFLDTLAAAFGQRDVTREDRERTELYRRRAEGMVPSTTAGADLTAYLESLAMRLDMHDRSLGDRSRAVQLINKTNQFNANGRRWTDDEVGDILAQGGGLITASLSDRTGNHGEIAACLFDSAGVVRAFVMSCRVFQRRVEHAFMVTLMAGRVPPTAIRFARTARNEPFEQFVADDAFAHDGTERLTFDAAAWSERHRSALALFDVQWQNA